MVAVRNFCAGVAVVGTVLGLLWLGGVPAGAGEDAAAYAGTYRIDDWAEFEEDGIRHRFVLKADGGFEIIGQWPGREESRFTGTWVLGESELVLQGTGEVRTNQGSWTTEYIRTFRIGQHEGQPVLTPVPEKNRYGLLGWPNSFVRQP